MAQTGKPEVTLLREVKNFAETTGVPRTVPGRPGYVVAPHPMPLPQRQSQPDGEGLKGGSLLLPGHSIFVSGEPSSLPAAFIALLPHGGTVSTSYAGLTDCPRVSWTLCHVRAPGPSAGVPPLPSLGN